MSFLQPMNFDSAFRPVSPEHPMHPPRPNGVANRAQLCRGNDAKCCRRAGQRAVPVGPGAELVWDENAFCCKPCPHCGGCEGQCGCREGSERSECTCSSGCEAAETECRQRSGCDHDCDSGCTGCRRRNRCDACECAEECVSQRSGCNDCDNDCDACGNAYAGRRQRRDCDNDCDTCGNAYAGRRQRRDCDHGCDSDQTTGMVYHVEQSLEKLFCAEQALQAGTAYPELYKPMNCADDPATNCPSCQQEKAFLLWELRLYLDTHPCDKKVLCLYRQLARELGDPNYASTFDEDGCGEETWNWVNKPWPWECGFRRSKN